MGCLENARLARQNVVERVSENGAVVARLWAGRRLHAVEPTDRVAATLASLERTGASISRSRQERVRGTGARPDTARAPLLRARDPWQVRDPPRDSS